MIIILALAQITNGQFNNMVEKPNETQFNNVPIQFV